MAYAPQSTRNYLSLGPKALPLVDMRVEMAYFVERALAQVLDRLLKEQEIARPEYRMLRVLEVCGLVSVGYLHERTGVSRQHTSASLKWLESRGWVERHSAVSDLRLRQVTLTSKSYELLAQVSKVLDKVFFDAAQESGEESLAGWLAFNRALVVTCDACRANRP